MDPASLARMDRTGEVEVRRRVAPAPGWMLAVTLVWAAAAIACDGDRRAPVVPERDAGRADAASPSRDAGETLDATPEDASFDGEVGDAGGHLGCGAELDVDLMTVGRDSDRGWPPHIAVAASATELVAVLADDADGPRRLTVVRGPIDGTDVLSRSALPGVPEGASSPAILEAGGGWLVAYERPGGGIELARFDEGFGAAGPASTLTAAGEAPALAAIGTGAFAAWRDDGRLLGRPLSLDGAPAGDAVEIASLPAADAAIALAGYGSAGEALAAVGSSEGTPARVTARRIEAAGAPSSGTIVLGATTEAEGAVAIGAATPEAPGMLPPLPGAAAFDVKVGSAFPEVRFVLLSAAGSPAFGEFTVSEHGERAWGASVAPFGTGYAVAYRARPVDGGFPRVRLAVLDRESCELGRVSARFTAGVSTTESGSATALVARGGTVMVGWAEVLVDVVEYRVAIARCR